MSGNAFFNTSIAAYNDSLDFYQAGQVQSPGGFSGDLFFYKGHIFFLPY
jgi:hypothetical protein